MKKDRSNKMKKKKNKKLKQSIGALVRPSRYNLNTLPSNLLFD